MMGLVRIMQHNSSESDEEDDDKDDDDGYHRAAEVAIGYTVDG